MSIALGTDEVHLWSAEEKDALPRVLGLYLDREPQKIELRRDIGGKPRLAGRFPPLRFNLSHSGGLALVAVSARLEVGVDVEAIKEGRDFGRLANRWLGAGAGARVRETGPDSRARVFYAVWARREAVAKCLGTGLARSLPETVPVSVRELDVGDGHAAALAVAGDAVPVVRRRSLLPAVAVTSPP